MSLPADLQALMDQAVSDKATADGSIQKAVADDATAKASDVQAKSDAAKLNVSAAAAIAGITNFLVVSPPAAPTPQAKPA